MDIENKDLKNDIAYEANDALERELDDDELRAQLRTAYDALEPDAEAESRMLGAVMGAQAEKGETPAGASETGTTSELADGLGETPAGASETGTTSEQGASTHKAAQASVPKKDMKPWLIGLPVAACLVALAIFGMNSLNSGSSAALNSSGVVAQDKAASTAQSAESTESAESAEATVATEAAQSAGTQAAEGDSAEQGSATGENGAAAESPASSGQGGDTPVSSDSPAPADAQVVPAASSGHATTAPCEAILPDGSKLPVPLTDGQPTPVDPAQGEGSTNVGVAVIVASNPELERVCDLFLSPSGQYLIRFNDDSDVLYLVG